MTYGDRCKICGTLDELHDYEHEARVCYPALVKQQEAEIERLRAALIEIRDTWINIPPEDLVANLKATAAVALDGDAAAEKLAIAYEQAALEKSNG